MPTYTRRPFAMGNTAVPVLSQPEMRGPVMKDSSGEFADLVLPSELVIETEDPATSGGISTVFSTSRAMVDILASINTAMAGYATAEEQEGCLLIRTTGVGGDAYIRVNAPISGFDDAAAVFGFPVHPHPLATVAAGDLEDAPVRPRQQVNPVGTKHIATGEDRVGSAYNRALHALGGNSDLLYTWLRQPVARMVEIEVDAVTHAAYITTNADGSVDQVDLTDLTVFEPGLEGKRLSVGGPRLSRSSALKDISAFYAVLDSEGKQIPAGDRTVRIGAVTRGQRTASMPTFADEASAPASPLPDTAGVATDGGNALGVNRTKHAAATITEITERTTVVCAGALFVTAGVQAGDEAVIIGAGVDSPFNHDGTYVVDVVVSEEALVLRPHPSSGHVRELNPATGVLGSVAITSGREFERDLWVSFSPPIPRFPEDGKITLVIPVEEELGQFSLADVIEGDIRGSADVAGWTILQLWRNLTLDGAYQGMAAARGSGFYANITHRPIRFDKRRGSALSAGTTARSSTGTATLDAYTLRLTAAATDRFDVDDAGKTILLTAGPLLADEPWTIVRLIDNATVEIAPPMWRSGYQGASGVTVSVTSWEIVDSDAIDVFGLVSGVSPEYFGDADTPAAPGGFHFWREQRDQSTTSAPAPGAFSFLHMERVRLTRGGTNITITTAGPLNADDILRTSFAPEDSSNFFAETYDTKTAVGQGGTTFVRILNGPNAGLYRVKDAKDASVSGYSGFTLQHLDGSPVTFTPAVTAEIAIYNAKIGGAVPVYGGPGAASAWTAALSLFEDAYESGAQQGYPLRILWRGDGAGIFGWLNDEEFKAYDNGDGADGPAILLRLFSPAEGVDIQMTGADTGDDNRRAGFGVRARAHTNRFDLSIDDPTPGGVLLHTNKGYAGYFSQTGKDPALVVLKQERDEAGDESAQYSKLSPAAAIVAGRAGAPSADPLSGPSGRGSAAELAGSLYVYRRTEDAGTNPTWSEGGIYSESVVAAGRWLYPMSGMYDFEASPFYGTGTFSGWEMPTQLGTPGVVYPPLESDTSPSADFLEPDYTIFNFDHVGMLHIADVTALVPGALTRPYNRLVGCRVYITDPSALFFEKEFSIIGSVEVADGDVYFALHSDDTEITSNDIDRYFVVYGQRWHEAHLNIGEWLLFGASLERGALENAQLHALLADPIADAVARAGLAAPSDPELQTVEALSPYAWAGVDGVRVGLAGALATMPAVDVTAAAYTAAINWPLDGYYFIEHGWASDSFEPRSPFPNFGAITMGPDDGPDVPVLDNAYKGSLLVDDVAISFPDAATEGQLTWSANWGGSLHLNRAIAGSAMRMRLWRPGHSLLFKGHLAVKITLLVQVSDGKTLTLALRKAGGDIVASENVVVSSSTSPQEVSVELRVLDEEVLHRSGLGGVAADRAAEMYFPTLDAYVENTGDDIYVLEFRAELLTKPVLQDGPLIVAGQVLAHGFRYANPVRGYLTCGPMEADMLCGPHFGIASGDLNALYSKYPNVTGWDHIGVQELDGMPGRIRVNYGGGGLLWYQVVAPKDIFFQKGMHAAAITLNSGAYDPVFYIWNTTDPTAADPMIHPENFQFPGRTGFVVPLNVPHGALLTSLAVSMSFRPSYYSGDDDTHWGVFRTLYADLVQVLTGEPTAASVLDKSALDTAAGVYVELWRHNNLDMGIEEDQNAEFNESLPPYGFSERLARLTIDLSEKTPPEWNTNQVDAAAVPSYPALNIYAGKEHFERRNWDLLQAVDAANQQVLRVDRRHYSYFLTITFWGGPRRTAAFDGNTIYQYPANPGWGNWPFLNNGTASPGSAIEMPTVRVSAGYPGEYGGPDGSDNMDFPPVVKFRGARVGWITDRGGNGGWGP